MMGNQNLKILALAFVGSLLIPTVPFSLGYTYDQDVYAINLLYTALGSPPLPGWIPNGGDPCTENWQGVSCALSNITSIILPAANLGGQLGDKLNNFSSLIKLDLSNNHIGGSIPSNLPATVQQFYLSANQFTGSIPSSLSALSLLTALSLNNNLLTGELPDSFQALTSLTNLNLAFNNLTGGLPPSLRSCSSLTTLDIQNNQLTGSLDVLQDLPLQELNIENNFFSGPVPVKLYSIPNFKRDGNQFNTSIAPSPSSSPRLPPPSPTADGASSGETPPSTQDGTHSVSAKRFWTTGKVVGGAIVGVALCAICVLSVTFCVSCPCKSEDDKITKRQEFDSYKAPMKKATYRDNTTHPPRIAKTESSNQVAKTQEVSSRIPEEEVDQKVVVPEDVGKKPKEQHEIDMTGKGAILMPPPVEKVVVNPIVRPRSPKKLKLPSSVEVFTVAALQQYTNSFRPENLIGGGMLGNVYRAELPGGKVLAVKKLDVSSLVLQSDEAFLDLVSAIGKLQHQNIVKLEGYCMEHGQRLLVYEYCSNGTLYEAIHFDDPEFNKKLSWNSRILMALGIARALEYLHEVCEPHVVHGNLKSANVLLDNELLAHVSDCGLAPLIATGSVNQLSGHLRTLSYCDPQSIQSDTYTSQSDVYSFGVVMLELLTGRKPYDSLRPRGEQSLVEWARHQLHDFTSLQKMVDPCLAGTYTLKSISKFADIISLCVQEDPSFRPPMSDIVQQILDMMPRRRRDGESF
ncbi:protein STRUBBELIG-RECEPTOR FAMILY 3-like isoform X2 [Aristolochia californica]|uniref:protein STRUBBELIG-RECEPTOR FAMILY 3-like isoform X2 n=1 Tax=Aristolochia californica TaxID=171875 RepID=UPI0035DE5DFD